MDWTLAATPVLLILGGAALFGVLAMNRRTKLEIDQAISGAKSKMASVEPMERIFSRRLLGGSGATSLGGSASGCSLTGSGGG